MSTTTFNLETSHDKDIKVLSYTKYKCLCNLADDICTSSKCKRCETGIKLMNCYNELAECDQLNVDNQAWYLYSTRSMNSLMIERKLDMKDKVLHIIVKILLILAFLFGIFGMCVSFASVSVIETNADVRPAYPSELFNSFLWPYRSYNTQYNKSNKEIYDTLVQMNKVPKYDINKDGLVNCIDASIRFKLTWDMLYPTHKLDCIMVRVPKHLFIAVDTPQGRLFVEPQANLKYDNIYSIIEGPYTLDEMTFNETERWLIEISTGPITDAQYSRIKSICQNK